MGDCEEEIPREVELSRVCLTDGVLRSVKRMSASTALARRNVVFLKNIMGPKAAT